MPKVVSQDGTTIAYNKSGQGPVLILVLGALNKRGSGKRLAEQLDDHFTVISYDRRGRGDSTETMPYSIKNEVNDIAALVDQLGGNAFLYGHSSGAVLALLAAKELEKKVTGLALYELPYNDDAEAHKESEGYRKELAQLLADDRRGDAVALFVRSVGVSDKQVEAMKRLPMWKGLTAMAPTLAYDTIELMRQYPETDTHAIKTATLVMYGAKSPGFMGNTAEKLCITLPNAKLQSLEGQGHDVKTEALAPVLAKFFSQLS